LVWYLKSLFRGLGEILANLDTLSIFLTVTLAAVLYVHHVDTLNLIDEVNKQRAYDARRARQGLPAVVHSPLRRPLTPVGEIWPDNPFGL
jgi:hypothetical protein